MDKVDKTKENIRVTKLDQKTRKDLFEKFVDSGGKVIDDKSLKKNLAIDREKQKRLQKRYQVSAAKKTKKEKPRAKETRQAPAPQTTQEVETGSFALFVSRLQLRFKLKFLGLTGFDGYYFNNKFFYKFNNIYKSALMELQILFLEIFKRNLPAGKKIITMLDEMKPLYYELIEMTGSLFDKIQTDQIIEQYINFPEVSKKVSDLREPLLQLYKKIHVMYPYENSILMSFEQAINLYARHGDSLSDSPAALRKKMRNDIFIIFHKLFPRLHLLFCVYEVRRFIPFFDASIGSTLAVTNEEKPGNRTLSSYFNETPEHPAETETQESPAAQEREDDEQVKAVKHGLEIMSKLDISKLKNEYDKTRLFDSINEGDKVIVTYFLFNEFEKEYSCVLTTNKIKFKYDATLHAHADFKARLIDLYDQMKKNADGLKEYADELKVYEKTRREKPTNNQQYIEFTKRLEAGEKKKNIIGKKALSIIRTYMYDVSQVLLMLINDMNAQQLYIENPQEELIFDPLIEGEKKINMKKVYEALYIVYCYASAFVSRLSPGGDLSGNIDFKKDELESAQKSAGEAAAPGKPEQNDTMQQKSILEELDDML